MGRCRSSSTAVGVQAASRHRSLDAIHALLVSTWRVTGSRYFSYPELVRFSMVLLVLAGQLPAAIVGWAFVARRRLMISFWYRRTTAPAAGIKALVINVVGDVGRARHLLHLQEHRTLDLLRIPAPKLAPSATPATTATSSPVACCLGRRIRQVRTLDPVQHGCRPMGGPTTVRSLIQRRRGVTAGAVTDRAHAYPLRARPRGGRRAAVGAATPLMRARSARDRRTAQRGSLLDDVEIGT